MYKCILIDKKGFNKRIDMNNIVERYTIAVRPKIDPVEVFYGNNTNYPQVAFIRIDFKLVGLRKGYHIFQEIE